MNKSKRQQSGTSLVEVLVAIGVIAVILVTIGFSVTSFVDARSQLVTNMKALYLLEEGHEMMRMLRDDDWNTLAGLTVDTEYYFAVATTTIVTSTTPEVIDSEFYRTVLFTAAYRDGNDDLTASTTPGAVVDSGTRVVTVSVGSPTGTTSLQAIITNINAI